MIANQKKQNASDKRIDALEVGLSSPRSETSQVGTHSQDSEKASQEALLSTRRTARLNQLVSARQKNSWINPKDIQMLLAWFAIYPLFWCWHKVVPRQSPDSKLNWLGLSIVLAPMVCVTCWHKWLWLRNWWRTHR